MARFDLGRRLPGRGAWVCASPACLDEALKPRKLAHAFRRPTSAPAREEALAELSALLRRQAAGLMGLAARAGAVVSGHDAVAEALGRGEAALLLLARDLAGRTAQDLRTRAGESVPAREFGTIFELGTAIGHPERGTAAVTDRRLAAGIVAALDRAAELGLTI
jgi:ribosomal protein L7Ae-like RNA K-turn-binding protein